MQEIISSSPILGSSTPLTNDEVKTKEEILFNTQNDFQNYYQHYQAYQSVSQQQPNTSSSSESNSDFQFSQYNNLLQPQEVKSIFPTISNSSENAITSTNDITNFSSQYQSHRQNLFPSIQSSSFKPYAQSGYSIHYPQFDTSAYQPNSQYFNRAYAPTTPASNGLFFNQQNNYLSPIDTNNQSLYSNNLDELDNKKIKIISSSLQTSPSNIKVESTSSASSSSSFTSSPTSVSSTLNTKSSVSPKQNTISNQQSSSNTSTSSPSGVSSTISNHALSNTESFQWMKPIKSGSNGNY